MSVSIRPIDRNDIMLMAPSSTQCVNQSPMAHLSDAQAYGNNVVSNSIFGRQYHEECGEDSKDMVFEDEFTRVGWIDLSHCRVLNQFLAGRQAPVWRSVLGLDTNEITGIINCKLVCNLSEPGYTLKEKLVPLSNVGNLPFDPEKFIYGADLLERMLDEVDIETLLINMLVTTYVKPHLTKDEFTEYEIMYSGFLEEGEEMPPSIIEFRQGDPSVYSMDGWLYDGFIVNLSNMGLSKQRCAEVYEAIREARESDDVTLTQFPMISLLTSMFCNEDGKDILKSQILDYVFVLPRGYRPTIDGRVDVLTSQYNKLVNATLEMKDIFTLQNPNVYTVVNKYSEIVRYVRNIFIGDDDVIRQQNLADYKSISDTITGKEGLMRGRMQGVRVDYSGRTVITCDPTLPIDTVGIPINMLAKIAEPQVIEYIKTHSGSKGINEKNLARFSSSSREKVNGKSYMDYLMEWLKAEPRYGIIGRQPTLFYLGMQAFKVKPIKGDAIALSPLIVMPFNADFDGDQMHFNMPITKAANHEIKTRMAFSKNIRYPKNGEITVITRHEIIYGLWACTAMHGVGTNYSGADITAMFPNDNVAGHGESYFIYEAVCRQYINVYDTISSSKYGQQSAGKLALQYAIYENRPDAAFIEDKDGVIAKGIKAKYINKLLLNNYNDRTDLFLKAINRLVHLGFCVARIWPPNISTIVSSEVEQNVLKLVSEFNHDVLQREEYVNMGIEIEEEYTNYFNNKWNELGNSKDGKLIKYLLSNLDSDNGYISMMNSGGKGDQNNIMQIFGIKGRVQKNDTSAFNSIVAGAYSRQLTGLEHFITAYGSRKGIADKVLATADPGYLSRKLEHAGSTVTIVAEDCGTTDGIEFTLEDIVPFLDDVNISPYGVRNETGTDAFYNTLPYLTQLSAAREYLSDILIGRYVVEQNNSIYIDSKQAAFNYIDKHWGYADSKERRYHKVGDGIVKMRSPIYCNNPCCAKCYGKDIAAGIRTPENGRAVGFIAAQAIGEPGTQMTMKNFQKGGVVSDANLTSAFTLIEDYFELHDFSKRKTKHNALSYDMLSPIDGTITEQYLGNGTKRVILIPDNPDDPYVKMHERSLASKKIIVHAQTNLKEHVKRGDSLQKIQGNLNMVEVLKFRGFDKAASYLSLNLYNIFKTQDVNFKHFETIVSAMSLVCLKSDIKSYNYFNSDYSYIYKAGTCLTWSEYMTYTDRQAAYVRTLVGLKTLPKYKSDFFESLLMESMDSYVPRAILVNPHDTMSNPITRAAFGLRIGIGSDMEENK